MGAAQCTPCSADTNDEESDHLPPLPPGPTIPSAIHSGNAWEHPMPETPLPDIEITVVYVKSEAPHDQLSTLTALEEARKLRILDRKQRSTTPPSYSFRLQSYASTWRLKAAIAELSGCPSKYQYILCDGMTEESCKECNRAATLLSELPAYREPVPPKPKVKPLTLPDPLKPKGNASDSESEDPAPLNPVLNLVVMVPSVIPKKTTEENKVEPAVESKEEVPIVQGYSDDNNHSDRSSSARSSGLRNANVEGGKATKSPEGSYQVLITDNGATPETASPSGDPRSEQPNTRQEAEAKQGERATAPGPQQSNMELARRVFEEMNIQSEQCDLLQVTVGLSNFGYDGLELYQAKKFFEAMDLKIRDKITVEDISFFLSQEKFSDQWVTGLRKSILAQLLSRRQEERGLANRDEWSDSP